VAKPQKSRNATAKTVFVNGIPVTVTASGSPQKVRKAVLDNVLLYLQTNNPMRLEALHEYNGPGASNHFTFSIVGGVFGTVISLTITCALSWKVNAGQAAIYTATNMLDLSSRISAIVVQHARHERTHLVA
jgi:hypothetical protein